VGEKNELKKRKSKKKKSKEKKEGEKGWHSSLFPFQGGKKRTDSRGGGIDFNFFPNQGEDGAIEKRKGKWGISFLTGKVRSGGCRKNSPCAPERGGKPALTHPFAQQRRCAFRPFPCKKAKKSTHPDREAVPSSPNCRIRVCSSLTCRGEERGEGRDARGGTHRALLLAVKGKKGRLGGGRRGTSYSSPPWTKKEADLVAKGKARFNVSSQSWEGRREKPKRKERGKKERGDGATCLWLSGGQKEGGKKEKKGFPDPKSLQRMRGGGVKRERREGGRFTKGD